MTSAEGESADISEIRETVRKLEPYIDHKKSCTMRSGTGPERDFCTCGVDDIVADVDETVYNGASSD